MSVLFIYVHAVGTAATKAERGARKTFNGPRILRNVARRLEIGYSNGPTRILAEWRRWRGHPVNEVCEPP